MHLGRYIAVPVHRCRNITIEEAIGCADYLQRCRDGRNGKRNSKRLIDHIVGIGKIVLRRCARQGSTIELGNRTEIEREAYAFGRGKTAIECKRVNTRLVDGKGGAVCRMADSIAIRLRISIKQQ